MVDDPVGAVSEAAAERNGPEPPSQMALISRAMVKLYKEQFGRGPTKVRTNWAGEDTLVCTLEDSLTPAERNLVKLGEHQRLRDVRMFFQSASVREFCAPVEEITGRTVRSFVSGIDTAEDVSIETFVLYPRGSEGPSRADRAEADARNGGAHTGPRPG